jgi:hypothetical protein
MARNLHVYPKAVLDGSTWTLLVKVYEHATGVNSRFLHSVPAGVTVTTPLHELKVSFDLVVADTDTDQDVDDALFIDDIKPGAQIGTVWSEWQGRAETIISGLAPGFTLIDYWSEWKKSDTAKTRNDARRALVTQRGWTIVAGSVHQHEGDGTNTDE